MGELKAWKGALVEDWSHWEGPVEASMAEVLKELPVSLAGRAGHRGEVKDC